ncbi:MAG: hypothetical protein AB7K86_18440, partial [Rhodospirillales bacterium]
MPQSPDAAARRPWLWSALGAAGILAAAAVVSSQRLFWFDELFTYYLAVLPVGEMVGRLRQGIDHIPPGYFALVHAALSLPIDPHVAARLPSMAGIALAAACTGAFVARRTRPLYGALAAALLLHTAAFDYAIEARPYGLALGFFALALLSWQRAGEPGRGGWSVAGVAVGIGAGISTSYFSSLVVIPIAAGELARIVQRRAIDWPVALAITAGSAVALAYLPFVGSSLDGFAALNWASPTPFGFWAVYDEMTRDLGIVLIAVAACIVIAAATARGGGTAAASAVPVAEAVALAAVVALPLIGLAVAYAATNKFTMRYFLGASLGFAIVPALVAAWAARQRTRDGRWALAVAVALFVAVDWLHAAYVLRNDGASSGPLRAMLSGQPADLPVAVDDPHRLLTAAHYDPPQVARRLWYLIDPEASHRISRMHYSGATWR